MNCHRHPAACRTSPRHLPSASASTVTPDRLWALLAVALLAVVAFAAGCSRRAETPAPPKPMAVVAMPAGDWPVFRGDASLRGVATGALPAKLVLRWTYQTGDAVKSSPVIAGGRVFIGTGKGQVVALAAKTGALLWTFAADGGIEAPPLVAGDLVVAASLDGTVCALDAATGTAKWTYKTGGRIAGSANAAPGPTGALFILVGSYDNQMYCLDGATGKLVWSCKTGNYINGAPAIADDRVVFGGCDAVLHVLRLASGESLGEIQIGSYLAASPAVADGRAYAGQYEGQVFAADLTRFTLAWTRGGGKDAGPFMSCPAVTADRVLLGSRDGNLHCFRRSDGTVLWKFRARGDVDSSPVVCGDKVVVGASDSRLYLLRLSDGTVLWEYETGGAVTSSPALGAGLVVVGADDGLLYAFGPAAEDSQTH